VAAGPGIVSSEGLQEEQSRDASTMACLRKERSATHEERDQAQGQVERLEEEQGQALADLVVCTMELEELSRAHSRSVPATAGAQRRIASRRSLTS
jgi:hypothetical protein